MSATVGETAVLARTVARKSLVLRRRYAFNTVTNLLTVYVFFALVVFGGRTLAPGAVEDSLSGIVVGFFLLLMASVAYADLSWELIREAQWGTLEQLYMSPLGFGRVVAVKTAVNLLVSFAYGVVLLAAMLVTTDARVTVAPIAVLVLGALTLCSAVGVGFALGGLALVFKRIESVFQLVQFGFVALIALPVESVPLAKLLPLAVGSHLLRQTMSEGTALWALPAVDLALLGLTAVGYAGAGYYVFRLGARRARRSGRLGQY
ncbi:ABC transporter permease [Halomarina ordinaria]|uniref:ABC transporter permease n=1 Tax=Halomarina ordinaria TaxID=3033939 RepID=A0ABD5UBQ5_9EURY|nr:ABC transporter permease [Halomarina sp. PSRA2]